MLPENFNGTFDYPDLPVGTLETVRKCLDIIKTAKDKDLSPDNFKYLELFFSLAATPYYDCMWSGMSVAAAYTIFKLSDMLSEETRKSIKLYPYIRGDEDGWNTLEDFRVEWKKHNPVFRMPPNVKKQIEELLA